MKICVATIAVLACLVPAYASDLSDAFDGLKAAEAKKDPDAVKQLAGEVFKLSKTEMALPKPTDPADVDHWKERQTYAKDVEVQAEYALAVTADTSSDPAKTVALVDELLAQNPKSQYLGSCSRAYLAALKKVSPGKAVAGAQAILAGDANNEDALYDLAVGTMSKPDEAGRYASRLVNVTKSKGKPEGESEADWERTKNAYLGQGYYIMGAAACTKQTWTDCDRDIRSALPMIGKEPSLAGPAYFYLGLADYRIAKLTDDHAKMEEALKYSQQSAAIAGPMQGQAQTNANAIRQELAAPKRR